MKCLLAIGCILGFALSFVKAEPSFNLSGDGLPDQVWIGAQTWANRLQDWHIADGRIECIPNRNLPMRTLHLLSHDLNSTGGSFKLGVELGRIESSVSNVADGAAGFLLGAGNGEMDYRGASLIHQTPGTGAGIFAGIDHLGRVFIHDNETGLYTESAPLIRSKKKTGFDGKHITLICSAKKKSANSWNLAVRAHNTSDGSLVGKATATLPAHRLIGTIALTADPGQQKKSIAHFWFNHWQGSGNRLTAHTDRRLGPVIGTHYTVSRKILKISAQMAPLPKSRQKGALLEIQIDGEWKTIAEADVDPAAYTAVFRIENWDDTQKVPYRVTAPKPLPGEQAWSGTIQKNPRDKQGFVVAAFTGNHNLSHSVSAGGRYQNGRKGNWIEGTWFPHADITASVVKQEPDLLFFSGDQVYESASPSFPDGRARDLDYLYKWYVYMWAFRDLTCDIPTVCIPDDHDVFQGNFWGQGGRHAKRQNDGGYTAPADFVKMVERTQTANLPDPVDPRPVEQGIGVYFTALNWGQMSFAIIEDRKFKTGPNSAEAKSGDESKLVLLGNRQLSFIEKWAEDWSDGAAMKASLTATVFSQLHTWRNKDGSIEQDPDTNGWPVNGRNKALRALRKGYTLMIGGDQHLATTAQHGVDEHGDSGWSICVPSIANYFPRSWKPLAPGKNRTPGMPEHLGEFLDGWGNKVTMHAVANPGGKPSGHKPAALHDRMPGYGIIRFDQTTREIEMANWPRYATLGNGIPYPGWPITINQTDNYGRKPTAWLPEINSTTANPVVQVFEKESGKLVYALRIKGNRFQPGVFAKGTYIVKVGNPDTDRWAVHTHEASPEKTGGSGRCK
jgi:hypothetical protein